MAIVIAIQFVLIRQLSHERKRKSKSIVSLVREDPIAVVFIKDRIRPSTHLTKCVTIKILFVLRHIMEDLREQGCSEKLQQITAASTRFGIWFQTKIHINLSFSLSSKFGRLTMAIVYISYQSFK